MDRRRRPAAPQSAAGGVPRLLAGLGCTPAELGALALLIAGALAALGMFWLLAAPGREGPRPGAQPVATEGVPGGVSGAVSGGVTVEAEDLIVHVAGRVTTPGVYRLPGGARVGDAVEVAGGALPDAVLDSVNLARPLTDGEQLFIPGPGDGSSAGDAAGGGAGAGAGATGASGAVGGTAAASARRPDGTLDLNRATPEELDELPGIGPVLAERIVEHRGAQGFRAVADLRDVPGIGEKTFQELAPLVSV